MSRLIRCDRCGKTLGTQEAIYIIWPQAVDRYNMETAINRKEIVIHNILASMGPILEAIQLQRLENTIRQNLHGLTLEEECTQLSTWMDDNDHMVGVFLANKKLEGCKEKSLEQYRITAKQFFAFAQKNFRDVTKDDVKLFLAFRMRDVKPNTLRNSKLNLSTFFGWLHAEGYITANPVPRGGMRVPEIENIHLTAEEEVLVRDACATAKEAAMIDFLLSTGVRVGELEAMDVSNIDFHRGTVTFQGEKGSRKYRTVVLDAAAKRHLEDYLSTRAGLQKPLTVHVFRRTFATRLANQGCPLETIQALMGHVKAETTQRYIARSQERVVQAASKYFKAA